MGKIYLFTTVGLFAFFCIVLSRACRDYGPLKSGTIVLLLGVCGLVVYSEHAQPGKAENIARVEVKRVPRIEGDRPFVDLVYDKTRGCDVLFINGQYAPKLSWLFVERPFYCM